MRSIISVNMFLYRYNKYTDKYYKYDTDFYDILTPMFDDTIHPTDDEFEFNSKIHPEYALKCAFCNTEFDTRSQLFKHLAYMGINVRNCMLSNNNHYNIEKGEFGIESKQDFFANKKRYSRGRKLEKKKRPAESSVEDLLENLNITDTCTNIQPNKKFAS